MRALRVDSRVGVILLLLLRLGEGLRLLLFGEGLLPSSFSFPLLLKPLNDLVSVIGALEVMVLKCDGAAGEAIVMGSTA